MDKQVFAWNLTDGRKAEIVVEEIEIKLQEDEMNADGWKIKTGKKHIVMFCNAHLYVEGKSMGWCGFLDNLHLEDAKINGNLYKKIHRFPVYFKSETAERYEAWLDDVIESAKPVEVKEFEAAQEEEKAKSAKSAAPAIKHDVEKERAYDMTYNEGGEGYNPYRFGSTPTYWTERGTHEEPIKDLGGEND